MAAKYHHNNKSKAQTTNLIELREAIVGAFDCIKLDLRDVIFDKSRKKLVYQKFANLSEIIMPLRPVYSVDFFLTDTMAAYETLSGISDYRTPVALKAFSKIFMTIFPIIFAPFFASLSSKFFLVGLAVSFFYSIAFITPSNIQDNIENPFAGQGLDDLDLDGESRFLYSL